MGNRKIIIYIFIGCHHIKPGACALLFCKKASKVASRCWKTKKTIVFKEVKYSGEKKGGVDWEIKAKIARKYIDKPLIELEIIRGAV